MKTILSALALAVALALPAHAEDAHHPDQQPSAASAATPEQAVQKMQENATRMQSQLEAVAAAKTPEERRKLLMEHMQTMRENMMLGRQMAIGDMDCPMMGGMGMMHGGGMMMAPGALGSPDAMAERMQQMERRMDMMQMKMEGMSQPAAKSPGN